jgi:hypothetical protein
MRVFLSAFSGFTLAVPMNAVAAMMLYDKKTEKIIEYDQKNRSTFISLPRLFNLKEEDVRHGIILREWNSTANKVVLLTAEIKRDIEIPDKEFHPIPKSLGALRFSKIFSGIKFSDNPVLLLNIEQLTQLLQEEQQTLNDKSYSMEQPLSKEPPAEQPPAEQPLAEEPPTEQSLAEQPPAEEPPPTTASEPSPPPPEPESQIEPSTQIIQEEPQARNEIEPLTDQLVLEELPSEQPTQIIQEEPQVIQIIQEEPQVIQIIQEEPQVIQIIQEEPQVINDLNNSTVEPLTELLLLEDLPSEEPPSEQPLPEDPPSTVTSEIEPLTELLLLSEEPL